MGYSNCINRKRPMAAFTVFSAAHSDMENLPEYEITMEAAFPTAELAESHASHLNDTKGHTYLFWVLTAEELATAA